MSLREKLFRTVCIYVGYYLRIYPLFDYFMKKWAEELRREYREAGLDV